MVLKDNKNMFSEKQIPRLARNDKNVCVVVKEAWRGLCPRHASFGNYMFIVIPNEVRNLQTITVFNN
jgi:hypothetical protein